MKPEKRTKRTRSIIAYHFISDKLRDGRKIPADGELLTHPGTLKLCESGLHASRHPYDALGFAPGSTLCLVNCSGTIVEGDDKLVCSERKIIARFKADELLWKFARQQAMTCMDKWDAPKVVKDYLTTGGKSLRSASGAAVGAARSAARSASGAAVGAARSAARKMFLKMVREEFKIRKAGTK